MKGNNQVIGGTGMAVLGGIVLVIVSFTTSFDLLTKLGFFVFGVILIFLGLFFSKS